MNNLNNLNTNNNTNTKEKEKNNMNNLNITNLIKNTNKVEDLNISTKYMNEVKTWDVFLFYKYYRDHRKEQNELQYAARTWVELHIVDYIKPEEWAFFIDVLKYVYAHTRTKKYEAATEEMLLDELGSGRTAEARRLIKEDSTLALAEYNTEEAEEIKEKENTMNILTEEKKEAIEKLKELNTVTPYTDDVINEIYEIILDLNIYELEYKLEDIYDDEAIKEYIKETADDLDSMIYRLEDCHAGAQYYIMDAYGNFRDIETADLEILIDDLIDTIKEVE